VPDSKLILEKGSNVLISVYGIHHDPLIYSQPEIFDVDRFSPEEVSKRHQMSFIPFGKGPRICIGERFGYLETKIGLVTLLSKFRFKPSEKTTLPLNFSKENIILSPQGGMWLKIEKI
jgi:cytochrome P450 family 6